MTLKTLRCGGFCILIVVAHGHLRVPSSLPSLPRALPPTYSFEAFLTKLKENSIELRGILDIGANQGSWTEAAHSVFSNAHFLMVDADERKGCEAVAAKYNSSCVIAVLSDKIKDVVWYRKSTGSSYLKEQTGLFNKVKGVNRTTDTLDSMVEKFGNGTRFQYIKIDVQGAEIDILKGGSKTVSSAEFIQLEMPFGGVQYNHGAPSFSEEIKYLDEIGFTPVAVCEQHEVDGYQFQVDLIFAKKDSAYIQNAQKSVAGIR